MQRKYMMLSMMIMGPKQSENDIYVYLTPSMMSIWVIILRCVPYNFAQLMTFMHTLISLSRVLRDIKRVIYVKMIHAPTN